MKTISLVLIFSLLTSGCMTAYKGPGPDMSLTGAAAQEEVKKFSFVENGNATWTGCFHEGERTKCYRPDTVKPVIESVSAEAADKFSKAQHYDRLRQRAIWAAILLPLVGLLYHDDATDQVLLNLSALSLGFSLAIGLGAWESYGDAGKLYNRDLKKKLTPTVGFNFSF